MADGHTQAYAYQPTGQNWGLRERPGRRRVPLIGSTCAQIFPRPGGGSGLVDRQGRQRRAKGVGEATNLRARLRYITNLHDHTFGS